MEKVLNFLKNHKVAIAIILVILVIGIIGLTIYLENKKKEYSLVEISEYKYFVLQQDDKYGVIDTSAKIIIDPIYDNIKIPNPQESIFICKTGDKSIILNENKEELFTQYEEVSTISVNGVVSSIPYEKTVLKYKQDGKYGIISYEGKELTKAIYEEINGLENKESELIVKLDEKYGVINSKGATLIDCKYDNVIADGFYTNEDKYGLSGYIVRNKTIDGYRYGYINYKLETVLEPEYVSINRLLKTDKEDICLIACKNGQYGVVKNGENFIKFSYQGIEYNNDNKIFELQRNGQYGIVDYNGNEIIPVEYDEISINGLYIEAIKDEEVSYYNISGEKIEDLKYSSIIETSNENYYITINQDDLYGVIDANQKELISNKYNYIEYAYKDYFIAANDKAKIGVINSNGDIVIDFKYDVLQKIDDKNIIEAKILRENKTELYSINMKNVYTSANVYVYKEDKYIKAYTINETKYFDLDGRELSNSEVYDNNKLFASKKTNKWGFVDKDQNVVINYEYDRVTEFNAYGYAGIMKDNKWGVIDESGNIIVKPVYEIETDNSEPEFLGKYYRIYYGYGESYFTDKK